MSNNHSFAVDNLRQYVEYVDGKNNQLAQIVMSLNNEVMLLKKIVTKLKNGEEIEEDAENTPVTTAGAPPQMVPPQMGGAMPQMNPQMMTQMQQFAQMPQLQTLNLTSGSSAINN